MDGMDKKSSQREVRLPTVYGIANKVMGNKTITTAATTVAKLSIQD
jgi:hypothetical protein